MLVTRENLDGVAKRLAEPGEYSLDTEATGLRPYHGDELFSLIICDGPTSWYFNFKQYEGLDESWVLPREDTFGRLEPFFINPENELYLQNAKFDMAMLAREGIHLYGTVHDTEVMGRLLYNRHLKYDLGTQVRAIGLEKSDAVEKYIAQHKLYTWIKSPGKEKRSKWPHYDRVPFGIISSYGETDGDITWKLGRHQRAEIARLSDTVTNSGLSRSLVDLVGVEAKVTKVCFAMEQAGIKVDLDYCRKAYEYELGQAAKATLEFEKVAGMPFKDSRITLAEAFTAAGEKYPVTAKGNPSFTDVVLEGFTTPLAKLLQAHRAASKKANTYFANFMYFADHEARIHPNMRQAGTDTGRFSYSDPNCISIDTEVLTEDGWVACDGYVNQKVACFDIEKQELKFLKPSARYVSTGTRSVLNYKNTHYDMLVTPDHRCLFQNRKLGTFSVVPASDFQKDAEVLHGAVLRNTNNLFDNPQHLRLLVAMQADGHFTSGAQAIVSLRKPRKIRRLLKILEDVSLPYRVKYYEDRTSFIFGQRKQLPFEGCLSLTRKFTWRLLQLSEKERAIFLEELRHWDGTSTRQPIEYASGDLENCSVVQAVASLDGRRALVRHYANKTGGSCYIVNITNRNYSLSVNTKKLISSPKKVWCLTVPTGYFLVRRNGKTFVTGNCQNIPKDEEGPFPVRRAFVPTSDEYILVAIDFNQMEYRLLLDYANEREIIRRIIEEGLDVHEATGQKMGVPRKTAKTLNFGLLYGMGAEKLARGTGKTLAEAKKLKYKYFAELPGIQRFSRGVTQRANTRGFVFNWAGRVCHFPWLKRSDTGKLDRFAYRAPNHIIQGGCADIVKIAMVECFEYLKSKKSRMLIQLHDEVLYEIHKDELAIVPELQGIMEKAYPYRHLPMTCSVDYSEVSWADKKPFDINELQRG